MRERTDRGDDLASLLSQPWSEALAAHVQITCVRIRMLTRALRRERSDRHQTLARLHSLRTTEAA